MDILSRKRLFKKPSFNNNLLNPHVDPQREILQKFPSFLLFLDALASLEPILFTESVSQSVTHFFWIADNLRIHHEKVPPVPVPVPSDQMSDVRFQMTNVRCQVSDVRFQMTNVRCQMSDDKCKLPVPVNC